MMNNRDALWLLVCAGIAAVFVMLGFTTEFEGFFYISQFSGGIGVGIAIAKEFLTKKKGGE